MDCWARPRCEAVRLRPAAQLVWCRDLLAPSGRVSTADSNDIDLVERLAREAAGPAIPFGAKARLERASSLDLTISMLAKQLSKRATDPLEDRRSRQLARTGTYNAVRPVIAALADHHRRLSRRGHRLALGSAAIAAAIVTVVAFRLS